MVASARAKVVYKRAVSLLVRVRRERAPPRPLNSSVTVSTFDLQPNIQDVGCLHKAFRLPSRPRIGPTISPLTNPLAQSIFFPSFFAGSQKIGVALLHRLRLQAKASKWAGFPGPHQPTCCCCCCSPLQGHCPSSSRSTKRLLRRH